MLTTAISSRCPEKLTCWHACAAACRRLISDEKLLKADSCIRQAPCAVALIDSTSSPDSSGHSTVLYSNDTANSFFQELQQQTHGEACSSDPSIPNSSSSSDKGHLPWKLKLPQAVQQADASSMKEAQLLQGAMWGISSSKSIAIDQLLVCPVSAPNGKHLTKG